MKQRNTFYKNKEQNEYLLTLIPFLWQCLKNNLKNNKNKENIDICFLKNIVLSISIITCKRRTRNSKKIFLNFEILSHAYIVDMYF